MLDWKDKIVVKSHVELVELFPILKKYEYRVFHKSVQDWLNEIDQLVSPIGYEVISWAMIPTYANGDGISQMVTFKKVVS